MQFFDDEYFMRIALKEAEKGFQKGEVPVGSVIVYENNIISRSHNLVEFLVDATAHAEMQAITSASDKIGNKFLNECSIYVTLEPCSMCAGALFLSRIKKLVFGASDIKYGFQNAKSLLHPKTEVKGGVLANDCANLLSLFFELRREEKI